MSQNAPSRNFISTLRLRSDGERCVNPCHNLGAAAGEKFALGLASVFVHGLPLSDSLTLPSVLLHIHVWSSWSSRNMTQDVKESHLKYTLVGTRTLLIMADVI